MSALSVSNVKLLNKIQREFNYLVGAKNDNIKNIFIDFFKNASSTEIIGKHFEHSLEKIDRKNRGQYYTPSVIAEYIISQLNIKDDSKILDPACGCGSFLLTIFDLFKDKYGIEFLNNIHGVDINEDAVKMTQICLYLKSTFNDNYIDIIKRNIKVGNSIVINKKICKNGFDWYLEFNNVMCEGGFDFIIGNPPYVTISKCRDFDLSESIYKKIVNGSVNAASLMIGRSLELLKKNGILAFLLPKSILHVNSYSKLRKYIVENTEILKIFDLGSKFKDVRGEQVILIIKKKMPLLKNEIRINTTICKDEELSNQPFITIQQNKFVESGRFLTFSDIKHYKIIERISRLGVSLEKFVNGKIFRGVSVGGNYTQPKTENGRGVEVVRGKDIKKYIIRSLNILNNKFLEGQSKEKIKNIMNRKVVLQNIFSSESGVIAAYDDKKLLTLDTVTNILVSNDKKGKYILALLNSKLINFYLMYGIFNRSRLTMHMDKSYIGLIPIKENPNKIQLDKLIEIIDLLREGKDLKLQKEKNRQIDELVYDIYSLKKEEIEIVEEGVLNLLSEKSLW